MSKPVLRLIAANCLLLFAFGVYAKSSDRDQPMDIDADSGDLGLCDNETATLKGSVSIVQGTLEVSANQASVECRKGEIAEVIFNGAPARLKQINDNGEPINATARRVVYKMDDEIIILTGAVKVEMPRGEMRGESIRYNTRTGRVEGGGGGNRIKMRILPRKSSDGRS